MLVGLSKDLRSNPQGLADRGCVGSLAEVTGWVGVGSSACLQGLGSVSCCLSALPTPKLPPSYRHSLRIDTQVKPMLEEVLQYGGLYCTLTSREARCGQAAGPLCLRESSVLSNPAFKGASGAGSLGSTNAWAEALGIFARSKTFHPVACLYRLYL